MEFLNFKEWLISEMPYYNTMKIPSLDNKPFFLFDDKQVVSIDFRLERNFNMLNSLMGSRWYARIPDYIQYADGQLIHINPIKGSYIIVNSVYKDPETNAPYISISSLIKPVAKKQMEIELRQKITHQKNYTPTDLNRLLKDEIEKLPPIEQLYTRVKDGWLNYAVITIQSNHQRASSTCEIVPFTQTETIDLFDKTQNKNSMQKTQVAIA